MHIHLLGLAAIAGSVTLMLPSSAANANGNCTLVGTAAKPIPDGDLYYLPSGFAYRNARVTKDCGPRARYQVSYGLLATNGKVLIPGKYHRIYPISGTSAVVQLSDGAPLRIYRYGKGEVAAYPQYKIGALIAPGRSRVQISIAETAPAPGGVRDYYLYSGESDEPVVLKNLIKLDRFDDAVIAHFVIDGQPVSRVLDLHGRTASPIVGRIDAWQTVPEKRSLTDWEKIKSYDSPVELVASLGDVGDPDLPFRRLYLPLDGNGIPLPMPAGALGVMPLPVQAVQSTRTSNAYGWAVIYASGEGFQVAPSFTALRQALTARPSLTGLSRATAGLTASNRLIQDAYAARGLVDNRWRIVNIFDLKPKASGPGYSTSAEAYAVYVGAAQGRQTQISREIAAERAVEAKANAVWRESEWARIRTAGTVCAEAPRVVSLGVEALSALMKNCTVSDPRAFKAAAATGVAPALIAAARSRYDAVQQRDAALLAPPSAPIGTSDPWAAGLSAAMSASNNSYNSFVAQQNSVYARNLNAWNSGAQNWCCSGAAPR
ncbi:MAG: hypothetical protein EOP58_00135 [Sphingomonadales bacterium]|nr:MAG: hypothetical protein EOP58_00135 [Sphingomonadales bacterium]